MTEQQIREENRQIDHTIRHAEAFLMALEQRETDAAMATAQRLLDDIEDIEVRQAIQRGKQLL